MTKKNIAISSIIGAVILLVWDYVGNVYWCTWGGVEHYDCLDTLSGVEIFLLPILPIALLSLITYKMRDEVFNAWMKFAIWFVPLTMFLTFITPDSSGSLGLPAFGKGVVAFLLTALFTIISILIILVRFFTSRKQ